MAVCFFSLISAEGPKGFVHLSTIIHGAPDSSGQSLCIQFSHDPFWIPRSWGRHSVSLQFLAQWAVSHILFWLEWPQVDVPCIAI